MAKFKKSFIDSLQSDISGERYVWDDEIKGFGIRILPSGAMTYVYKYRNAEGRQRKLKIGPVRGGMTPTQAYDLVKQKQAEVRLGGDPAGAKDEARQAITVAELCDLWLSEAEDRLKPTTYGNNRGQVERHIKPLIGKRKAAALTHGDIAKLQADIIAGKTAAPREGRGGLTRGGKAAASRTVSVLGTILEYARRRKIVTENVMRGVERPATRKQKRFLTIEEVQAFGQALLAAEADGEPVVGLAALRFLLLSGCRRREALSLPQVWIDRKGGCIRFEDTKTGAQIRPVGASAFAVLDDIPHRNGWAFPAVRGPGHFIGLPRVLERICERANLRGVTIHVLRHSFAALAAEMGFSELTIAGLLGHSVASVTGRYAHVPDRALVGAANQVSARIAAALAGQKEDVNVIDLRDRTA